jgi:hypothetical protein
MGNPNPFFIDEYFTLSSEESLTITFTVRDAYNRTASEEVILRATEGTVPDEDEDEMPGEWWYSGNAERYVFNSETDQYEHTTVAVWGALDIGSSYGDCASYEYIQGSGYLSGGRFLGPLTYDPASNSYSLDNLELFIESDTTGNMEVRAYVYDSEGNQYAKIERYDAFRKPDAAQPEFVGEAPEIKYLDGSAIEDISKIIPNKEFSITWPYKNTLRAETDMENYSYYLPWVSVDYLMEEAYHFNGKISVVCKLPENTSDSFLFTLNDLNGGSVYKYVTLSSTSVKDEIGVLNDLDARVSAPYAHNARAVFTDTAEMREKFPNCITAFGAYSVVKNLSSYDPLSNVIVPMIVTVKGKPTNETDYKITVYAETKEGSYDLIKEGYITVDSAFQDDIWIPFNSEYNLSPEVYWTSNGPLMLSHIVVCAEPGSPPGSSTIMHEKGGCDSGFPALVLVSLVFVVLGRKRLTALLN